ncbi:hypothetical protein Tco_1166129 [Tanacetum coccineum]
MLAPKCSTYNGRPTFANPRYLKKAQSEKPCLYEIPYDTSDLANRFAPNREETMTLSNESRSKLNKDYVKPYDYTRQNSLYSHFKLLQMEIDRHFKEMLRPLKPIPLVGIGEPEGSDDYIESSIDDLVPIPRESEVTSDSNLECDMPNNTPLPTTNVREEIFDINSPLGEYVVDFLMENVDVADLPRHLVKQLFSHLLKNPSLTKGMSDEPLGDDSKPRSYDEFEDISSLDPPELTPVIDESTLLVTLPLPCTDILGDAIVDINLPLGEPLDTLLTGNREIDFNPSRDIEELERLLADDLVLVPRVFDDPLGNFDSMSRSSETTDLFEELIAEISLDDLIPIRIDDRISCDLEDLVFDPFLEIPSNESKVHIEVLSVLWGNRLPISDGSLSLSR